MLKYLMFKAFKKLNILSGQGLANEGVCGAAVPPLSLESLAKGARFLSYDKNLLSGCQIVKNGLICSDSTKNNQHSFVS